MMIKQMLVVFAAILVISSVLLAADLVHQGSNAGSYSDSGSFTPVSYNLSDYTITVYGDHVVIGDTSYYFSIYTLENGLVKDAQKSIKVNRIVDTYQNTVAVVTSGSNYQFTEIFDAGMNGFNPTIVLSGKNMIFSLQFRLNGFVAVSPVMNTLSPEDPAIPAGQTEYSAYFSGGFLGVTGIQWQNTQMSWMNSPGQFLLGNITYSQLNGLQSTTVTLFFGIFNYASNSYLNYYL